MKKLLRYKFVIFFPYSIILWVIFFQLFSLLMLSSDISLSEAPTGTFDIIFTYWQDIAIAFLCLFYIITLISAIVISIKSQIEKWPAQDMLFANMIIKLAHIPAYILFFVIGFSSLFTIFTFAFSFIMIILDLLIIFTSGLIGAAAVLRAKQEKRLSLLTMFAFAITQFIYCIDVPCAIIMFLRYRDKPNMQNSADRKQSFITHQGDPA